MKQSARGGPIDESALEANLVLGVSPRRSDRFAFTSIVVVTAFFRGGLC